MKFHPYPFLALACLLSAPLAQGASPFELIETLEDQYQAAEKQMDFSDEEIAILKAEDKESRWKGLKEALDEADQTLHLFSVKNGYSLEAIREKRGRVSSLKTFVKSVFRSPRSFRALYAERKKAKTEMNELKKQAEGESLPEELFKDRKVLSHDLKQIKVDAQKFRAGLALDRRLKKLLAQLKDGKEIDRLVRNPYCQNRSFLEKLKDLFRVPKKRSILMIAALSPSLTSEQLRIFKSLDDALFKEKDSKDKSAFDYALIQNHLPLIQWLLTETNERGKRNLGLKEKFDEDLDKAFRSAYETRNSDLTAWLLKNHADADSSSHLLELISQDIADASSGPFERGKHYQYLLDIFSSIPTESQTRWLETQSEASLGDWIASQVAGAAPKLDWFSIRDLKANSRLEVLRGLQRKARTSEFSHYPSVWMMAAQTPELLDAGELKALGSEELAKKDPAGVSAFDYALRHKQNAVIKALLAKEILPQVVGEENVNASLERAAHYAGENENLGLVDEVFARLATSQLNSDAEKTLKIGLTRALFRGFDPKLQALEFRRTYPVVSSMPDIAFPKSLNFALKMEELFPEEMKSYRKAHAFEGESFFRTFLKDYLRTQEQKPQAELHDRVYLPLLKHSKADTLQALSRFKKRIFRCETGVRRRLNEFGYGQMCRLAR